MPPCVHQWRTIWTSPSLSTNSTMSFSGCQMLMSNRFWLMHIIYSVVCYFLAIICTEVTGILASTHSHATLTEIYMTFYVSFKYISWSIYLFIPSMVLTSLLDRPEEAPKGICIYSGRFSAWARLGFDSHYLFCCMLLSCDNLHWSHRHTCKYTLFCIMHNGSLTVWSWR